MAHFANIEQAPHPHRVIAIVAIIVEVGDGAADNILADESLTSKPK